MNMHEYQTKALLTDYSAAVLAGHVAASVRPEDANVQQATDILANSAPLIVVANDLNKAAGKIMAQVGREAA